MLTGSPAPGSYLAINRTWASGDTVDISLPMSLTLEPTPTLMPLEADPILELGERGTFDDNGIVGSCLTKVGDRRYLYYTGWNRGITVPFYLGAGLAVSDANGLGASMPVPIPSSPGALGAVLGAQMLWHWPSGPCSPSPFLLSSSRGVEITILAP